MARSFLRAPLGIQAFHIIFRDNVRKGPHRKAPPNPLPQYHRSYSNRVLFRARSRIYYVSCLGSGGLTFYGRCLMHINASINMIHETQSSNTPRLGLSAMSERARVAGWQFQKKQK